VTIDPNTEPDVPESVEGLRFNGLVVNLEEPIFFETMQAAEAFGRARHHRSMQAWREMLRARNSSEVRERGLLDLEDYANAG
jgi:hypothetical protein